jgi:hypothetical protein
MRILLTFVALAALAPLPAHAYLTPEEVLEDGDFVDAPPNARTAEAARAAQEAEYDARAAEEAEAEAEAADDEASPDGNTIDDLHGSADDGEEVIDWDPEGSDLTADERRDERVLERVERNRLDDMARNDDGVVLHGSAGEEPLHGGAPLAHTGSGTIAALLLGAVAVGYTLRKALRA